MAKEHSKGPKPHNVDLEMIIFEMRTDIEAIEDNPALHDEKNFGSRADAIDFIEFHLVDRINGLFQNINPSDDLERMKNRAEALKDQLEKIDSSLFQKLRAKIRCGECRGQAFRDIIRDFFGDSLKANSTPNAIGYDNLDVFMDGLFPTKVVPEETNEREPEMVFYQKTPVRIIFELVDKAHFNKNDVFYDLGSGLGQVAILVNLLSGVTTKGVEFEPAYSNYAKSFTDQLNLPDVKFINADARKVDYSDGTIFFMYTPFEGGMLNSVLENLRSVSKGRAVKLFTYGPCTLQVARQNWLSDENKGVNNVYKLGAFRNFEP